MFKRLQDYDFFNTNIGLAHCFYKEIILNGTKGDALV